MRPVSESQRPVNMLAGDNGRKERTLRSYLRGLVLASGAAERSQWSRAEMGRSVRSLFQASSFRQLNPHI